MASKPGSKINDKPGDQPTRGKCSANNKCSKSYDIFSSSSSETRKVSFYLTFVKNDASKEKKLFLLDPLPNTVEMPKQMQDYPFLGKFYPFLISLVFTDNILNTSYI